MEDTGERILPENIIHPQDKIIYFRHILAYLYSKNFIKPTSLVLDFGSGEGYGTKLLSETGATVYGVDYDNDALEHSRAKYPQIKFYSLEDYETSSDSYDLITCFQVIEHIEDDKSFIKQLINRLSDNGILMISTPNKAHRLKDGQKPWNKFHVREYTKEEFESLLQATGLGYNILGIVTNDKIFAIEKDRIKAAQYPQKNNINILSRIKGKILKIFNSISSINSKSKVELAITLEDFKIAENIPENSLDFIAILHK